MWIWRPSFGLPHKMVGAIFCWRMCTRSLMVTASLSYHDYHGIVLDLAEAPSLQADLGSNQHMILRNHGLITVGVSVSKAFHALYNLQRSREIQVAAQGQALNSPSFQMR